MWTVCITAAHRGHVQAPCGKAHRTTSLRNPGTIWPGPKDFHIARFHCSENTSSILTSVKPWKLECYLHCKRQMVSVKVYSKAVQRLLHAQWWDITALLQKYCLLAKTHLINKVQHETFGHTQVKNLHLVRWGILGLQISQTKLKFIIGWYYTALNKNIIYQILVSLEGVSGGGEVWRCSHGYIDTNLHPMTEQRPCRSHMGA